MRLGIFQIAGGGLTPLKRLEALQNHVKDHELDLVVCPELFLSGYHVRDDHHQLAEPVDGPFSDRVAELARRYETGFVYGYPERDRDRLYNSAAFVGKDGEIIANHRKRLASPNSFEEETFANGDSATLVDFYGFRVAILICYEVELAESVRLAALKGAELVVVPTALIDRWGIVAEKLVPTRAFENGVWLAYANHAGHENGFTYLGGSRVVAPDGQEKAVAGGDECMITTTIDKDCLHTARRRLPYLRDAPKIT